MDHLKSAPDPVPLRALVATLEGAGIPCALGGSGLLAGLGLTDTVGDWDVTVDAPARRVWPLLDPARVTYAGSDAVHADEKLMIDVDRIEIICRFAFEVEGRRIELPTIVGARVEGVPLASPEVWAVAYALLGRTRKSNLLFEHLGRHGVSVAAVAALLAQPLPAALANRLEALASRGTSSST